MSDLLEDAAPPLTVNVTATRTAEIAELDLYDRADLQRADKAAARAGRLADAREAGLDAGQTCVELGAVTDRRWGEAEWIDLANSTDGQLAILERAFERANPGGGRQLLAAVRWSRAQRLQVVAHVAGLDVTAAGGGTEGEDEPADPRAGHPAAL